MNIKNTKKKRKIIKLRGWRVNLRSGKDNHLIQRKVKQGGMQTENMLSVVTSDSSAHFKILSCYFVSYKISFHLQELYVMENKSLLK